MEPDLRIADSFPAASYADWRTLVEADLAGATFEERFVRHSPEGFEVQALYTREDFDAARDPYGFPGMPPFVRGARLLGQSLAGTDLRQQHFDSDLSAANQAILSDLVGGATSIELRGDAAHCVDDLDAVLNDVDLKSVCVALTPCAACLSAANTLIELWQRRGVSLDQVRGAFNADPLTIRAQNAAAAETVNQSLVDLATLAARTVATLPHVTTVAVDTSPYEELGAPCIQQLAIAMASATSYLRTMTAAGLTVDDAARQILFRFGLGTRHFQEIARLRAARCLWARVIEAAGGSAEAAAMQIQTRLSDRVLTADDHHNNIFRNASAVFAAILGGAQVVTSVPFNLPLGPPDDLARRIARNTVLILEQEAHLNHVIDPAGGSWFFDRTTANLAGAAWRIFQEIERRGGMLAALESGWIFEAITANDGRASRGVPGAQ